MFFRKFKGLLLRRGGILWGTTPGFSAGWGLPGRGAALPRRTSGWWWAATWAPATASLAARKASSVPGWASSIPGCKPRAAITSFHLAFMRLHLEYGIQFWPQGEKEDSHTGQAQGRARGWHTALWGDAEGPRLFILEEGRLGGWGGR